MDKKRKIGTKKENRKYRKKIWDKRGRTVNKKGTNNKRVQRKKIVATRKKLKTKTGTKKKRRKQIKQKNKNRRDFRNSLQ